MRRRRQFCLCAERLGRTIDRALTASDIRSEMWAPPTPAPMDIAPHIDAMTEKFRAESPIHAF